MKYNDDITKTRNIFLKPGEVSSKYESRRTTFTELFFDLAVVFIFALLAERLFGVIGLSVEQISQSSSEDIVQSSNRSIGVLFWLMNFFALWFTWYQYTNYTKYHGIDNIRNNILMFFILLTLVLQGSGIVFDNNFLSNYSLLISFLTARIIFMFAQYSALKISKKTELAKQLISKFHRQVITTIVTSFMFVIYIILIQNNVLDPDTKNITNGISAHEHEYDPWKMWLAMSLIVLNHLVIRFILKVTFNTGSINSTYHIVFHTKERHHLFVIISLGEMLIITLSSSFLNNHTFNPIDSMYMILTPLAAIIIWYLYKSIFYKSVPEYTKHSYYIYMITHILLILGLLILIGSLKSHMDANSYCNYVAENPNKFLAGNMCAEVTRVSELYYTIGLIVGKTLIIVSMAIYACFTVLRNDRWEKIINSIRPILIIESVAMFIWLAVQIYLSVNGIQMQFRYTLVILISIMITSATIEAYLSQRKIKGLFITADEYNEFTETLDH